MKKVRVFIERGSDGSYGAYMPDDNNLPYGITGDGATAEEAVDDFMASYRDMRSSFEKKGLPFVEAEFDFSYDLPSFLLYYADIITYKGLSKLTGISASQLSQYISGYRRPSAKTTAKIQKSLNAIGSELASLRLL